MNYLNNIKDIATPKLVLLYHINGFHYAAEFINKIKPTGGRFRERLIKNQLEFLEILKELDYGCSKAFIKKLIKYLDKYYKEISIEYLVILIEKVIVMAIRVINEIINVDTYLPNHLNKYGQNMNMDYTRRVECETKGDKDDAPWLSGSQEFSLKNEMDIVFDLYDKLLERTLDYLRYNRKDESDSKDRKQDIREDNREDNFHSALLQKVFDIWITIFLNINEALLLTREARRKLTEGLKGLISFVKKYKIPYYTKFLDERSLELPIETLCLKEMIIQASSYNNIFVTINNQYRIRDPMTGKFGDYTTTKVSIKRVDIVKSILLIDHMEVGLESEDDCENLPKERKEIASRPNPFVHEYFGKREKNASENSNKGLAGEHAPIYILDIGVITSLQEIRTFLNDIENSSTTLSSLKDYFWRKA